MLKFPNVSCSARSPGLRGAMPYAFMSFGAASVALLAAPPASAVEQLAAAPEPPVESGPALDAGPDDGGLFEAPPRGLRKLGLMLDLGTMDGGMMSLVYRPTPWIRFHGGGGSNGAAPGFRLGTAVTPWKGSGWSFTLDGGHFFPGNVNGLFATFAGADYDDSHLLERFDYDYVKLQFGWEVERNDLMFFARGGVGLLWTQLPSEDLSRIENLSSLVDPDGSVEAFLPSLEVGIIGFL